MLRLLILYIAIVIFLTLNPWILPNSDVAIGSLTWDLFAHAGAYCGLSVMLMLTFIRKGKALTITALVILACGLSGVLLEYCQYWLTETRQFSLFDALANFSGVILGAAVFWSIRTFAFVAKQHPVSR
ncbi:VanZ family protein [Crenothrix sp.]|uniref:VanZ family protein n=1 Tax=Crenothrix sp. TaxID=3100433 RepID=UPI00374CE1C3